MLTFEEKQQITALVRRQVVPAVGCTEPGCVALAVSRATELLGCTPEKIEARLSANILKNAMGVGIPGTGMTGLPVAIALGALIGRSEYKLQVLKDCTPEAVAQARQYIDEGRVCVSLKDDAPDKLYVEVTCTAGGHTATAVIACEHTRFVRLEKDGEPLTEAISSGAGDTSALGTDAPELTLHKVWEYATTMPIDEISFRGAAAQRAGGFGFLERQLRPLPRQGSFASAGARHYGRQHFLAHPFEHLRRLRCANGGRKYSRDGKFGFG